MNMTQTKAPQPPAPQLYWADDCATIVLQRPQEHNRIDPSDVAVLMEYLNAIQDNADARVLVVTGSGQKTFCSGYTLDAIQSQLSNDFEQMLDLLETVRIPTVCALNGSVYGGGIDLALCCDFRIGVVGSRMIMPAAAFGLHYYPSGLRRFVRTLGPALAKKILLTGLPLESDEMLHGGFLGECVAPDKLSDRVAVYLNALRNGSCAVQASMKQHIDQISAGTWSAGDARQAYLDSVSSPDLARRLAQLKASKQ